MQSDKRKRSCEWRFHLPLKRNSLWWLIFWKWFIRVRRTLVWCYLDVCIHPPERTGLNRLWFCVFFFVPCAYYPHGITIMVGKQHSIISIKTTNNLSGWTNPPALITIHHPQDGRLDSTAHAEMTTDQFDLFDPKSILAVTQFVS